MGTMLILAEPDSHRPCEACRMLFTASVFFPQERKSCKSDHLGR